MVIVGLKALGHGRVEGLFACLGVTSVPEKPERITIADAAKRLGKPEPTVRVWASRHHARLILKLGKTAWYDWLDLATIARQLHRGERVPATPEQRDELRASLSAAA